MKTYKINKQIRRKNKIIKELQLEINLLYSIINKNSKQRKRCAKKKMTKEQAFEYLKDTKTIVKDAEQRELVQRKLFDVGFTWEGDEIGKVKLTDKYFIYIDRDKTLEYSCFNELEFFREDQNVYVSPYKILGIELKEESK